MAKVEKIQRVAIDKLVPYENNAKKHSQKQLEKLSKSIDEFGFISPVLIDKKYNIIAGHGRVEAAKMSGLDAVPCVYIDGLTEAQRKAYILADNRLSEFSTWDKELVQLELEELGELGELDFDMDSLEFTLPEIDTRGYYGDERERTNKAYNLDLLENTELTNDFWQMPIIKRCDCVPNHIIGFNYAKSSKNKNVGIHFFIDDYQFERVWNYPDKYFDILLEYDCVLSPDFSLYMDMPMPMKIWNIYRSRQIGVYFQNMGLQVIPTLSWAEEDTFSFCFQGIEKGSVVAVSTIGVKEKKNSMEIWKAGMQEAINRLEPKTILLYGGAVDFDFKDIEVKCYDNDVIKNWRGK